MPEARVMQHGRRNIMIEDRKADENTDKTMKRA